MAVSRSDANWLEAQPDGAAAASMYCRIVFNECMGARSNSLDASMSSLGWKPAAAAQYSGAWKPKSHMMAGSPVLGRTGSPVVAVSPLKVPQKWRCPPLYSHVATNPATIILSPPSPLHVAGSLL